MYLVICKNTLHTVFKPLIFKTPWKKYVYEKYQSEKKAGYISILDIYLYI